MLNNLTAMKEVKRAVIGGASDGIGKAIAMKLCDEGYAITLLSRNFEKLDTVRSELNNIRKDNHSIIQLDFNEPDIIVDTLNANQIPFAKKLVLVNNVGGPMPKNISDCTIDDYQTVFNKYVLSFSEISKYLSVRMKENNWGRIINILGTTILEPIPGLSLSVIKSATANWSKALSIELGRHNITVNNILPGPTKTKELYEIIRILSQQTNKTEEQLINDTINKMSIKRFAEPAEIADGVAFLCSDSASFITGSNLKIDGGYSTYL